MKKTILVLTILLLSRSVFAQTTPSAGDITTDSITKDVVTPDVPDSISTSDDIDSSYPTKKGNSKELNINNKTVKGNPLADKKYGIEVNILRLLNYSFCNDIINSYSGGVSLFNIDRHAEITFQIYYSYATYSYWGCTRGFNVNEIPVQQFILDCHYRRFLGRTQKGFFIGGFIRYANLGGNKEDDVYDYCSNGVEEPKFLTENKLGIGFGIGYRLFLKMGFYWGISLNIGRYYIGENNIFYHKWYDPVGPEDLLCPTNDIGIIYSFELFKIGWAF